jgi:hypothetical protein
MAAAQKELVNSSFGGFTEPINLKAITPSRSSDFTLKGVESILRKYSEAGYVSNEFHLNEVDPLGSIDGMVDVYAGAFTQSILDFSDSGGWWRFGKHAETDDFADRRSVQLLLHPI